MERTSYLQLYCNCGPFSRCIRCPVDGLINCCTESCFCIDRNYEKTSFENPQLIDEINEPKYQLEFQDESIPNSHDDLMPDFFQHDYNDFEYNFNDYNEHENQNFKNINQQNTDFFCNENNQDPFDRLVSTITIKELTVLITEIVYRLNRNEFKNQNKYQCTQCGNLE